MVTDVGTRPPDTSHSGRRRRWPLWAAFSFGILTVTALITGAELGDHYQPVGLGNSPANLIGHMVVRHIDNALWFDGQQYVPPQRAARGAVYVSLTNNGPYPVTIVSVSLNSPDMQGPVERQYEALRDSGTPTYQPQSGRPGPGGPVAGLSLKPGVVVLLRIPVTTAACWGSASSGQEIQSFWVTTKFLFWTHQFAVWWTQSDEGAIVARGAEPASQAGGGCYPR